MQADVTHGMYAVFLYDWLQMFPSENLMFIKTEDYATNPVVTLKKAFSFLGLGKILCWSYAMHLRKFVVCFRPGASWD